jgi:V-type H+-transporting ATPase subunit a
MKISVIIGVIHMTLGVFVKMTNTIHFRRWLDFFFEFIPQLGFLVLLFGYMDFLIVYKWTVNWGYDAADAPSIITTMINIPLKLGKVVRMVLCSKIAVVDSRCGVSMEILVRVLFSFGFW